MIRSFLILLTALGLASEARAAGCASEADGPAIHDAASWRAYQSWCSACKGTVSEFLDVAQKEGGCMLPAAPGTSQESAAAGHQMDEHIAKAIVAGVNGDMSVGNAATVVGAGLIINRLLAPSSKNPEQEATITAQMAERQRALEAQKVESAARLQNEMLDTDGSEGTESSASAEGDPLIAQLMTDDPGAASSGNEQSIMSNRRTRLRPRYQPRAVQKDLGPYTPPHSLSNEMMKDPEPPQNDDRRQNKDEGRAAQLNENARARGLEHGRDCFSRRASVVCAGATTANEQRACEVEYENAYVNARQPVQEKMNRAYEAGVLDRPGRVKRAQAEAVGACQDDILRSYDAGFIGNPRP